MKKTFVLLFVLSFLFSFTSNAQLLFEENFDYAAGDSLILIPGWNHSGGHLHKCG